jgi:hypothetical protein
MFSLQQNWKKRGQNRFAQKLGRGETGPKMCTHVSKCKNDKIKKVNPTNFCISITGKCKTDVL